MVPSPADVSPVCGLLMFFGSELYRMRKKLTSQPHSFENQPRQDGLVIHPNSNRNYQCQRCLKSFPCHEPYLYHASKHGDTIEYICFKFNQLASLTPDIIAFYGVYCRRSTHYVRVTISRPLGPTSIIQRIDEEEELTLEEFLKIDFSFTERYKEIVKRVEEFDRQCCRPIYDTIIVRTLGYLSLDIGSNFIQFSTKKLAISATNGQDLVADDLSSVARNSLPENVSGVIAVDSFYSTPNGVCGDKLILTRFFDTRASPTNYERLLVTMPTRSCG
ncbi:hypothetical protein GGP41_007876, partial [Bipolaris sorokiniana]